MSDPFSPQIGYAYRVRRVVRVIDGDTFILDIDLGFRTYMEQYFRLQGVDTPELNSRDLAERERAKLATAFTINWLAVHCLRPDHDMVARTYKGDSFNRWIADVSCLRCQVSLGPDLVREGHATLS